MASKVEKTRLEETFDLVLEHSDFVDMMNDPQVLIDEGTVDDSQSFQLVLRKGSGAEVILKDMNPGDKLICRFRKVTITNDTAGFNDIDVT